MENYRIYLGISLIITLFTYLEAKPFSLNKAIAENSDRKLFETSSDELPEISPQNFHIKTPLRSSSISASDKLKEIGDLLLLKKPKKKRSPLKYKKKVFPKKSALVKVPAKPRLRKKYPAPKREAFDDEGINRRYLPLLRSISMLFDDILSTDAESNEVARGPDNPRSGNECSCSRKEDLEPAQSRTVKKTIAAAEAFVTEIPIQAETTTKETDYTTSRDVGTFRQNKVIPAILSRNTLSSRRKFHGIGQGSGAARDRDAEGNISIDRGNSEYDTGTRGNEAGSADDEENTDSDPRDNADSSAIRRGRLPGDNTRRRNYTTTETATIPQTETTETRGYVNEFKRENSIEIGRDSNESTVHARRNETKSPIYVPGFNRRLRGHTAKDKDSNHAESLQPKEFYEKGVLNVTLGFPSFKRKLIGSGFVTEKNKKDSGKDEGIIKDPNSPTTKNTMVMIIDGYSVARDKNGEKKYNKKQYKYINR